MQSRTSRELLSCIKCFILIYIEAWTRINRKLACTQVKCTWLLPTYINEVPYHRVDDIDFKSARKMKSELDKKIDGVGSSLTTSSINSTGRIKSFSNAISTDAEMKLIFSKLNESKKKPVILSVVLPYADQVVLESRRVSTLAALYDHENLKLFYPELCLKSP